MPTVSSFTTLINSRDTSLDSMYQVFLAMEATSCPPDAAVYNCHISMLCASGRLEEARGFLDLMLQEGVHLTVHSYTMILRGYCEQGKILEAERLVDDMVDAGCPLDVILYSVLIDGLCRVSELSKVERILMEIEERG